MEDLLEQFDYETEEYIEEFDIKTIDIFSPEEILADIVISNYKELTKRQKYTLIKKLKPVSLKQSIDLVISFLRECYNEEYVKKFMYVLDNKFVIKKNTCMHLSFFNPEDGKIYFNPHGNIYDPLLLLHEFMHYVNDNKEVTTFVSDYFTEAVSFYNEMLFEDFIEKNYPKYQKEVNVYAYYKELTNYIESIEFKILTHLLKRKLEGKKINKYFLYEALEELSDVPYEYLGKAMHVIEEYTNGENYPDFASLYAHLSEYVVGGVFSKYLYALHKKNSNMGIDINEILEHYDMKDLYDFLDINIDLILYEGQVINEDDLIPFVFDKPTQKKLEYFYKKEQKRA